MIRRADRQDLLKLIELSHAFHIEARIEEEYGPEWDLKAASNFLLYCILDVNHLVTVYEEADEIKGVLIAGAYHWGFSRSGFMASEIMLYVPKKYRGGMIAKKLVKDYEKWAREIGVLTIELGSAKTMNQQSTSKLFNRWGFPHNLNGHFKKLGVYHG